MTAERPRTSDASMAATGEGTAAAAAAAIAEEEQKEVGVTKVTIVTTTRGRQQSTIGHSWISTAFAICLDFNIDLTTVRERERELSFFFWMREVSSQSR